MSSSTNNNCSPNLILDNVIKKCSSSSSSSRRRGRNKRYKSQPVLGPARGGGGGGGGGESQKDGSYGDYLVVDNSSNRLCLLENSGDFSNSINFRPVTPDTPLNANSSDASTNNSTVSLTLLKSSQLEIACLSLIHNVSNPTSSLFQSEFKNGVSSALLNYTVANSHPAKILNNQSLVTVANMINRTNIAIATVNEMQKLQQIYTLQTMLQQAIINQQQLIQQKLGSNCNVSPTNSPYLSANNYSLLNNKRKTNENNGNFANKMQRRDSLSSLSSVGSDSETTQEEEIESSSIRIDIDLDDSNHNNFHYDNNNQNNQIDFQNNNNFNYSTAKRARRVGSLTALNHSLDSNFNNIPVHSNSSSQRLVLTPLTIREILFCIFDYLDVNDIFTRIIRISTEWTSYIDPNRQPQKFSMKGNPRLQYPYAARNSERYAPASLKRYSFSLVVFSPSFQPPSVSPFQPNDLPNHGRTNEHLNDEHDRSDTSSLNSFAVQNESNSMEEHSWLNPIPSSNSRGLIVEEDFQPQFCKPHTKATKNSYLHRRTHISFPNLPLAVNHCTLIHRFPNVRRVDFLADCFRMLHVKDLTLSALAACKQLTSLNIDWCWLVTDSGVSHLAACKQLQSLRMSGCKYLTDNIAQSLSRCKLLKELILEECTGITDNAIRALVKSCNHLETINLHACSRITDVSCVYLAKLKQLKHVELSSCSQITDAGLEEFRQAAIRCAEEGIPFPVQHLGLFACHNVSRRAIQKFCKVAPRCNLISHIVWS
jgi:hypothetical protein